MTANAGKPFTDYTPDDWRNFRVWAAAQLQEAAGAADRQGRQSPEVTARWRSSAAQFARDGCTEPGHPGAVPGTVSADLREVRRQYTPGERRQLTAQRDLTPGAPHPNPELARRGWQASDHGTYVRRPPQIEPEAG